MIYVACVRDNGKVKGYSRELKGSCTGEKTKETLSTTRNGAEHRLSRVDLVAL